MRCAMNNSPTPVIALSHIDKTYFIGEISVPVLKDISLTIHSGDYLSIMGPSGSGKSTLMNIIGCLDQPTRGEYRFNGRHVETLNDRELSSIRNRNIGFVFQNFSLLPRLTARENVEVPLIYKGMTLRERKRRAMELLQEMDLGARVGHKPNELSGGQRQRVAIARALATAPSVILADEPTGNLDSKSGLQIMEIFKNLHAQGHTIIMVTHEKEIAEYAQRKIIMRDGKIRFDSLYSGKEK